MTLAAKQELLDQIAARLASEIAALEASVEAAHDAATHEEAKPENQYDTRALEASYLAGAQKERLAELKAAHAQVKATLPRAYGQREPIGATALVEVDQDGTRSLLFVLAHGAGFPLKLGGRFVLTLTGQSPLGRALLGRAAGDFVTVGTGQGEKEYEILGVE